MHYLCIKNCVCVSIQGDTALISNNWLNEINGTKFELKKNTLETSQKQKKVHKQHNY